MDIRCTITTPLFLAVTLWKHESHHLNLVTLDNNGFHCFPNGPGFGNYCWGLGSELGDATAIAHIDPKGVFKVDSKEAK